jgi:hypothetical protein
MYNTTGIARHDATLTFATMAPGLLQAPQQYLLGAYPVKLSARILSLFSFFFSSLSSFSPSPPPQFAPQPPENLGIEVRGVRPDLLVVQNVLTYSVLR